MRRAFTMIETVFVIAIIGILASIIIPRISDNKLHENVIKFISHVKYTQHLGIINDSFNPSDASWFNQSYCMDINSNSWDINKHDSSGNIIHAINPLDKTDMHEELKSITILIQTAPQFNRICFDHLGRPMINNLQKKPENMIYDKIVLIFSDSTQTEHVTIEPETGYTRNTN